MIHEIYLKNWQCYRGEHTLKLTSKAYAITARYENDREHSNWGGKSALLEAVEFAVLGVLNKDRNFDANGWITRGEKEGCVRIKFEDGTIIERTRKSGSSTQVKFLSGTIDAKQDVAERHMLLYLGFSEKDYRTVAYFSQGSMAMLIRTEPEKRFDIIRNWLGLAKAEEAEERTSDIAASHMKEVVRLKSTIASYENLLEQNEIRDIEEERNLRKKLRLRKEELIAERKLVRKKTEYTTLIAKFEEIIRRGKEAAAKIESFTYSADDLKVEAEKLQGEYNEVYAALTTASKDVETKKKVNAGEFDGKCPVAPIECPATKKINTDRLLSKKALAIATEKRDALSKKWTDTKAKIEEFNERNSTLTFEIKKRESLRTEAEELRDEVILARRALKEMKVRESDTIDAEYEQVSNELSTLDVAIAKVESAIAQRKELEEKVSSAREELAVSAQLAATATQARSIFRATQRRLAERALNSIGRRANEMLLNSNVDLKIDIRWEREGKNLAKTCDMCGMAFPVSAKVKVCENCETERGLNIVHRLEFLLSDRSGAADDFGGIAMQLAAGSWLLRERQSPWATAAIDEPFAQMDKSVRKAAAKQLLSLLGSTSYRQVFVISHSEDTTMMYPGRIEIFVREDGMRTIEVQ